MATGKSRGAQSMLVLFFTELEASCSNYALLNGHHRVLSDKPVVIVGSLASNSILSFEFESHSTAYSSVIIAMLW
jgi:hypothetical protein